MARKTKLTPALQQAIISAVAGGVPHAQAALLVDVPNATANEWRQRGEGRDPERPCTPLYAAYAAALQKAEAQFEARRLLRINQVAEGGVVIHEKTTTYPDGRVVREVQRTAPQWQPSAWLLERRWPERYGRRLAVQADLSVEARRIAEEVGAELGLSADAIIREAQGFLKERDLRRR